MKHYILNSSIGIFLGYIFGALYISLLDKHLFDNYISNLSEFNQTFHGAYLPVIITLILLAIFELKKNKLERLKEIEFNDILLFIIYFGSILFGIYCMVGIGNIVFNFILILLIGEKNSNYLGGFECGSMAGFFMISLMYTKIKEDRRLRNLY